MSDNFGFLPSVDSPQPPPIGRDDEGVTVNETSPTCPHGCKGELRWMEDQWYCPKCKNEFHEGVGQEDANPVTIKVDRYRRRDVTRMTPIELRIQELIWDVEMAGAHELLTRTVCLLGDAQEVFADWIDYHPDLHAICGFCLEPRNTHTPIEQASCDLDLEAQ